MTTPQLLFYVILAILVLNYLAEQYLEYLNARYRSVSLPEELKGIYPEDEYKRSQQYKADNRKLSFISSTFNLLLILGFLLLDGFALVDGWAREITSHPLLVSPLFFGILFFALDLINTPFAVYDTFVIEERYGFNKTTVQTFFLDKIKGYILSAILGGGLLILVVWFYHLTGSAFWIYAWGVVTLFTLFLTMFYTHWIVPLFNKLEPLEEGDLKSRIVELCRKAGFSLRDVFVMDGSKRSTKANAFFSGLGRKKRIVLFDTLINELGLLEVLAVLAHEIGHYRKRHTLINLLISIAHTGIILYVLSLLVNNPVLSMALGVSEPSFHIALVAFALLYSPISMILGIAMNALSRKNEYQADGFAARQDLSNHLIEALKKLSVKNLSNLTPHPAYVRIHYSHPPLLERIHHLRQQQGG
ncbi:MAG TPA: M48 family metallopeptidase [Bacteroidales bacterium]|nr:M48 family metallopeptidase [Bacteroidales bacterium]